MSRLSASAKGAALGLLAIPIIATSAFAATASLQGDCDTDLVVGTNVRTASGTGTIKLKYTNGMGLTNSVALRISPIDDRTGSAWAGTTVVGPKTGGTYTLASSVTKGRKFTLNFRAAENNNFDWHWEGTLTY
ncbi:hypothetical protein [Actinoplanes sp. NBRC 101535]|uniref:hypothetical protein n=1 Tax=Actinoplanes sp. NBRC 101535 TaxID=3032196 RepID=UPI0024A0B794|nr:hypothetical protein [Actinoplanes sp. NBRC 101535]GLY06711.1 hypothetical protein Acsp01_70900 [Actinoplanes sp. NBRC 101535]